MYGMAKAGGRAGNRHCRNKVGTVGHPAVHQELEIVDSEGKPSPRNVEGEVTAGGPHSAIGYMREDGTIEPIRGKRIKSGDLAVMDEDGFIHVSGRTKDLIIRGGINIAPLEIDQVLLRHPGILDAAPVGVPYVSLTAEVICYVAPRPVTELTATVVAEHCRGCLPVQKTPKQVFIVSSLPKSDRGKVLRDNLKDDWKERSMLST